MNRGEIWWTRLPDPKNTEPGYRKPVLIIQSDVFNKSNIDTVICVVITSNLNLSKAPGNVLLKKKETNLLKNSVANVSQIIILDKRFLIECTGNINNRLLKKIELGVKLVLNL